MELTSLRNATSKPYDLMSKAGRIKFVRESILKVTQKYLYERYGIPVVTTSKIETSGNHVSDKSLKRYYEAFSSEGLLVTYEWLAYNVGKVPNNFVPCKDFFHLTSDDYDLCDDSILMEYDAEDFCKKYKNAKVVRIMSNDMSPKFNLGDYVGGKLKKLDKLEAMLGRDCIIKIKGIENYLVKRLTMDSLRRYNLTVINYNSSETVPVMHDVQIEEIYNIIWHRWMDK